MSLYLEVRDSSGNILFDLASTRLFSLLGIYPITWVLASKQYVNGNGWYNTYKGTINVDWSFNNALILVPAVYARDDTFTILDGSFQAEKGMSPANDAEALSQFVKNNAVTNVEVYRF